MIKKIKVPLKVITLEADNYHILLPGKFSDDIERWWIVDTGASKTVIDESLSQFYKPIEQDEDTKMQSTGIGESTFEAKLGELDSLNIGELLIESTKAVLLNIEHINKIYQQFGNRQIVGLIGGDILMKYAAAIHYADKTIEFSVAD